MSQCTNQNLVLPSQQSHVLDLKVQCVFTNEIDVRIKNLGRKSSLPTATYYSYCMSTLQWVQE